MDPGGSSVARTLPIDGALLSGVMARLRRDTPAAALRWNLGSHGVAEVDASFTFSEALPETQWTTTARLWAGSGLTVTPATVRCVVSGADEVRVTVEPNVAPDPARPGTRAFWELARACLDELAEELLWHATRAGLTQRG